VKPLPTAAAVAVLAALALAALVRGLRPRRRSIADVHAILYATSRTPAVGAHGVRFVVSGLATPLARAVDRVLGPGLRFVDMTASEVAARLVVSALGGFMAMLCVVSSMLAAGVLPGSPLWLVLAPLVGAAAGWIVWSDVQTRIARRRREFRRTVNDFVQLVAVGLTTDQSVDEAVHFALSVGDSDVFSALRDELASAPIRGVALWEALDQLGTWYQQRELNELGASIERQGTQGVSITDTVSTLAAAMRERALDDLEREADKVNANLAGPTIGFVVATIVFLAYPLAIRIGGAFGG
jgi:Flp pilus assembly protein TadB